MNPGLANSLRWHVANDSVCNGDVMACKSLGVDDGDAATTATRRRQRGRDGHNAGEIWQQQQLGDGNGDGDGGGDGDGDGDGGVMVGGGDDDGDGDGGVMVVIKMVWCCVDGSKTRSEQNGQLIEGATPGLKRN